jgi:hypothetical protein
MFGFSKRLTMLETEYTADRKAFFEHIEKCDRRAQHAIRVMYGIAIAVATELIVKFLSVYVHIGLVP